MSKTVNDLNKSLEDTLELSSKYSKEGHTHSYLPLTGGTMAGVITTPNSAQGIKIGDDAVICDRDIANHMVIEGVTTPTMGGITFGSGKDTNIYRGGTNILKTDDAFNCVGGYYWNGESLDTRYAAKSHGTHLTIGTTSIMAAAGNHTHSNYAPSSSTSLNTTDKTIVGAINEVFQLGNDAKKGLVDALVAKGQSCSTSDTWSTLISKISNLVAPSGTAVASNVLSGKTFINSTGGVITGTMTNQGSKTVTPKSTAQTLGVGYYSGITINGDSNLKASNILSGVSIFGVTGTASTGYIFDSSQSGTNLVTFYTYSLSSTISSGSWQNFGSTYTMNIKGKVKVSFYGSTGGAQIRVMKKSGSTTTYVGTKYISNSSAAIDDIHVDVIEGDILQAQVYPSSGYSYYSKSLSISSNICKG